MKLLQDYDRDNNYLMLFEKMNNLNLKKNNKNVGMKNIFIYIIMY